MDVTDSNQPQPCNKRTKNEGLGFRIDRISDLPDEIIHIILSFLPLRQAAATSVLSRRWPDLWKHSSNLDFVDTKKIEINRNSWRAATCQNVKMVNSVLESHQALFLKQFRISFYVNNSARSTVTKWLVFVQSRQVERLDLNLNCMTEKGAVVLEDLVREMRPMKYLKALSLTSMKVSGEDISYFLKNCMFMSPGIWRFFGYVDAPLGNPLSKFMFHIFVKLRPMQNRAPYGSRMFQDLP